MNLNDIRIFNNVMKQGSFAAVAKKHDIDPSSVSRTIANLEKELGFRLFQRTTRKLAPTEAGKLYFDLIQNTVSEFEIAQEKAHDLISEPMGRLKVAASTSFGEKILAPFITKLRKKYPELTIELLLDDRKVDMIDNQIDLAIRFGNRPEGDFISSRLIKRDFLLTASPSYLEHYGQPNNPEELKNFECLIFSTPGYGNQWKYRKNNQEINSVPVSGKLITSHGMTMTACALNGMGISLLPDWLCADEIRSKKLIRILPEYDFAPSEFDTAIWLTYPNRSYRKSVV